MKKGVKTGKARIKNKGRMYRKKEGFNVEGKRKGVKKQVREMKGRKKWGEEEANKGRSHIRKGS